MNPPIPPLASKTRLPHKRATDPTAPVIRCVPHHSFPKHSTMRILRIYSISLRTTCYAKSHVLKPPHAPMSPNVPFQRIQKVSNRTHRSASSRQKRTFSEE